MNKTRGNLERLVWKHTHRDFRSKRDDGTKVINHYIEGKGTCSVSIASLTDAELIAKLPARVREEYQA